MESGAEPRRRCNRGDVRREQPQHRVRGDQRLGRDRNGLQIERRRPNLELHQREWRGISPGCFGGDSNRARRKQHGKAVRSICQRGFHHSGHSVCDEQWRQQLDAADFARRPGLVSQRDPVAPGNPQVLYASGATLYESTDGGQTWASDNSGKYYADQHGFAFSGDGTRMYLADDGGVLVTTQPTAANAVFSSLNATLNTMTFYPGFSILAGQARLLAGSQDHGLNLYAGVLSWPNGEQSGYCGDGGSVYIDPKATYAYAHCEGGAANWVANPSGDTVVNNWSAAQCGIGAADRWPWVADIKGDWNTVSTVYTGTNRLYQSTNNGAAWTAISGDLTGGSATISTIAVSPTDSNTIYTGAGDGTVSVTTNALSGASATWKTLTGLPEPHSHEDSGDAGQRSGRVPDGERF